MASDAPVPSGEPTPPASWKTRTSTLAISVLVACLGYVLFDLFLNDLIALPMLEWSSRVAGAMLSALGEEVVRTGTILQTPAMRFEVVPACSGSTTLKVLIGIGIFYIGTYPGLGIGRKIVASLVIAPLAVFINGLRVTALVEASLWRGRAIADGPLHAVIGLFAFGLSLLILFGLVRSLRQSERWEGRPDRVRGRCIVLGLSILLLCGPFLWRCAEVWLAPRFNPLNRWGWILFVVGMAGWARLLWRTPLRTDQRGGGLLVFVLSLGLTLISQTIDLEYLLGIAFLGLLLALTLMARGRRTMLAALPLAGVILLSYPNMPRWFLAVLPRLPLAGLPAADVYRYVLGGALAWLAWRLGRVAMRQQTPEQANQVPLGTVLNFVVAVALAACVVQLVLNEQTAHLATPLALRVEYDLGDWVGDDRPVLPQERRFFGEGSLLSRQYRNGAQRVDVLVNGSGGDRHRNHPPEYCQTGTGWTVLASRQVPYAFPAGRTVTLTEMHMEKNGREIWFVYWFDDGASSVPSYSRMVIDDTMRRIGGRKTDWHLFRVRAPTRAALADFLSNFSYALTPGRSPAS